MQFYDARRSFVIVDMRCAATLARRQEDIRVILYRQLDMMTRIEELTPRQLRFIYT